MPRVLYVSHTRRIEKPYFDPSTRYRCYNPAVVLRAAGCVADVCTMDAFKPTMVGRYDAFVFHRPGPHDNLELAIDVIVKNGKTIFADYDDLIFHPGHAGEYPMLVNGTMSVGEVEAMFDANLRVLRMFQRFTVSTVPLARAIGELVPGAEVTVIHNGLDSMAIQSGRHAFAPRPPRKGRIISYLSGTKSHDGDWALVEDSLAEITAADGDIKIMVMGPLKVSYRKFRQHSIVHYRHMPYKDFLRYAGIADINIAPLESSVFNACKSGLKFFESGIMGIPTVASPIPDFGRFAASGGLLLARNGPQWKEHISAMLGRVADGSFRESLYNFCITHCAARAQVAKFLPLLPQCRCQTSH